MENLLLNNLKANIDKNINLAELKNINKSSEINNSKENNFSVDTIKSKDSTLKENTISNSIYYFDKKAKEFVLKVSGVGLNYQFPTEQILKIKEFLLNEEKNSNKNINSKSVIL